MDEKKRVEGEGFTVEIGNFQLDAAEEGQEFKPLSADNLPKGSSFDVLCALVNKLHGNLLYRDADAILIIARQRHSGAIAIQLTGANEADGSLPNISDEARTELSQQLLVDALEMIAKKSRCPRCGGPKHD